MFSHRRSVLILAVALGGASWVSGCSGIYGEDVRSTPTAAEIETALGFEPPDSAEDVKATMVSSWDNTEVVRVTFTIDRDRLGQLMRSTPFGASGHGSGPFGLVKWRPQNHFGPLDAFDIAQSPRTFKASQNADSSNPYHRDIVIDTENPRAIKVFVTSTS